MNYKELNPDHFLFREGIFAGREAILINPSHSDDGWTKDNLGFRSVVIDKDSGMVASRGWGKFFNYSQKPELYPDPLDFDDWEIYEKIDGSLGIFTAILSGISIRTRGTFDYSTLDNHKDFEEIYKKYPLAAQMITQFRGYSFLFEVVSPNQKIVINYPEIDFYFIGAVHNSNGHSVPTHLLDSWAATFGLKRPRKYDFNSFEDLQATVKDWRDREGVVVNYNEGRNKIKLKAEHYCFLHKIISGYRSKSDMVEKFIELGKPSFNELFAYYEKTIDYEFAKEIEGELREITGLALLIGEHCRVVEKCISKVKNGFTRREQAEYVMQHYKDWRKGYSFNCLDDKPLDDKVLKKLLNN